MCFSAGASFTAGVLLTFVGVETMKKVHKPSQIPFVGITLFFAFQQFAEGIVWTTMAHPGYEGLQKAATYVFLMLAQVIWPMIIPLSVLLLEQNTIRKRIIIGLQSAGAVVGLYNLYGLLFFHQQAQISGRHMLYQTDFKDSLGVAAIVLYMLAVIAPLFISSVKRMYILGIIMTVSLIISAVFYTKCLTSVWCFFAAVMSFMIFYIIRDSHEKFSMESAAKGGVKHKRKTK